MSNLYKRRLSLAGVDANQLSLEDLRRLLADILEAGIHGISFSPYTAGQGPGTQVTGEQIPSAWR